jgi:hypothetical protein
VRLRRFHTPRLFAAEPCQGHGAVRPARERQYETRSVGGAGGGGPVSPRCSHHNGVQPIPARSAEGVCRRRQRQVSAGGSGFRASGRGAEVLMWLRRNSDQPHPHRRRCNVLHAPRLQRRRRPARCLDRVETRTATRAARAVCVTLTDGPHCTLGLTWMRRACAAVAVMYTSSPLSSTCAPATGPTRHFSRIFAPAQSGCVWRTA